MRFGLALPHYDFSFPDGRRASIAEVTHYARLAEDAGFDSVWISDHLFLELTRYGGPPGRQETPEAMTTCAAVASATSRVRVGTLVLCAPFRNAEVLAQQVRSLQDLSGGRFETGIGAGWNEDEFTEAHIGFASASKRIAEMEQVAQRLRSEGPVTIGGKGGPRIAEAVARAADGWNIVWRVTPSAYEDKLAVLTKACNDIGRDLATVTRSVGLTTLLADDDEDLAARYERLRAWTPGGALDGTSLDDFADGALVGSVDAAARIVAAYAAHGVTEMILGLGSLPFSVFEDEQLELASRLIGAHR